MKTPSPRITQSNPVNPPGDHTATHDSVVHGKKMKPRNAQKKFEKAASHLAVSTSHHTRIAARGPNVIKVAKKQHMRFLSSIVG